MCVDVTLDTNQANSQMYCVLLFLSVHFFSTLYEFRKKMSHIGSSSSLMNYDNSHLDLQQSNGNLL